MRWQAKIGVVSLLAGMLAATGYDRADAYVQIARLTKPTPISAFRGTVAWSSYSASRHRYRLVYRTSGHTRLARVRSSAEPFDVTLGPDGGGQVVAVYSRCSRGGCDLFQYRFSSHRETVLDGPSTPRFDETTPAVWGSRLAFVRSGGPRPASVRLGTRTGARSITVGSGTPDSLNTARPERLALDARRLAYAWNAGTADDQRCAGDGLIPDLTELWLATLSPGRPVSQRLLFSGCGGASESTFADPTLKDDNLYFSYRDCCHGRKLLRRLDLATGATADTPAPAGLVAYVQDGPSAYFLLEPGATDIRLVRAVAPFGD